MAHVSHKLRSALQGALAGGGDPATSPLYVFGPFLRLIVVAGVSQVTFGASIWLVVFTVAMVSAMYRLVMIWVVDGSGGSGLSEEEFGTWAVKVNAAITFVEYTLTFLVSIAALVTFMADRFPVMNESFLGLQLRAYVAVALSILTGWMVNRGPRAAARTFGPATMGVLILLWVMIFATIWNFGFRLPGLDVRAFTGDYLHFTLGGYARILALMTGIEIFANLVAAYDGVPAQKSRRAFGSLLIIMGTTSLTMLIVGPAILELSDPTDAHVSVFTQTMDQLLPAPLPYIGTLVGIIVLLSAAAASAQGLQNLALGLRYRHYVPAPVGQRNTFDVADKPVWIEVAIVSICFVAFGTSEETYLAIYAAGVFILLSMTGWAVAKRLIRQIRAKPGLGLALTLVGTCLAALLTSGATVLIFVERFVEGAWTYFVFIPLLYVTFSHFRKRLGEPTPLQDHLGRSLAGQYLLPDQRPERREEVPRFERLAVPLAGSSFGESILPLAEGLSRTFGSRLVLTSVVPEPPRSGWTNGKGKESAAHDRNEREAYLAQVADRLQSGGIDTEYAVATGGIADGIAGLASDVRADLIVMGTRERTGLKRFLTRDIAEAVVQRARTPVILLRPTDDWRSRQSNFKKLLVSLDGSEVSESALRYARVIAKQFDSEIHLLVVPEADSEVEDMRSYLDQVAQALKETGCNVTAHVTGSGPARTIVEFSRTEGIDLVLMATHGRGGPERPILVGSVTNRVIKSSPCPVFVVPVGAQTL